MRQRAHQQGVKRQTAARPGRHVVPVGPATNADAHWLTRPKEDQSSVFCTPGRQVVPVGLSMMLMPTASSRALTASASSKSLACNVKSTNSDFADAAPSSSPPA